MLRTAFESSIVNCRTDRINSNDQFSCQKHAILLAKINRLNASITHMIYSD